MKTVPAMFPVLPGKLETWKAMTQEAKQDTALLALAKKGGLSRVRLWHFKAPDGSDMVLALHEGPNPENWIPTVMESSDPAAEKFRVMAAEVHGLTEEAAKAMPPAPELVLDWEM